MKVEYSKDAAKYISSQDRPTKQRIKDAVEKLPEGDVKPLRGSNGSFRLRVGGYRLIFSYVSADTILIEKAGPRGQIYKEV